MDFTDLMAQMRRNTEASNGLLEDTRLVAAMGSRLALSLFCLLYTSPSPRDRG